MKKYEELGAKNQRIFGLTREKMYFKKSFLFKFVR